MFEHVASVVGWLKTARIVIEDADNACLQVVLPASTGANVDAMNLAPRPENRGNAAGCASACVACIQCFSLHRPP